MKRAIAIFIISVFAISATLPIYAEDNSEVITGGDAEAVDCAIEEQAAEEAAEVYSSAVDLEEDENTVLMSNVASVYFSQDFTKWQSSDLSNSTTGTGTISKHKLLTDDINITVSNGAMTMTAAGNTAEQGMLLTPVSGISGKNVNFTFMLKQEAAVNGSSTQRNIYFLGSNDSGDGKYSILQMNSAGVISRSSANADASLREGDSAFGTARTDTDNYYKISVDFYEEKYNKTDCWSAYLYDENNNSNLIYEAHWSKDKFPNGLQGIWLMSYRDSTSRNNGAVAPITIKSPVITDMPERPALFVQTISHSGGQMEAAEKNIKITFNKEVDPDTLDGIIFTKENGDAVPGGVYISCGDTDKEVNVKFGRLDVGKYTLKITSALNTSDGKTAVEKTYTYEVKSIGDTPYIKHDFSKWPDGSLSNAELGIGEIMQISEVGATDCFEYSTEGKALRIKPTGASNVATVFLPNRELEDIDTVFTFKLRADAVTCSGDGYRYIGLYNGLSGASARNVEFIKVSHEGTLSTLSKKDPIQGAWKAPTVSKDDNCYYLKFRFTREMHNDVDCWGVYVYDLNTKSEDLSYTCHWTTNNANAFPNGIKGITFGAYRNGASVNAGDDFSLYISNPLLETDVDNLKTSPLYNSADGAMPNIDEITVVYDENLNESVFTGENISLMCGDKVVPGETEVSAEERTVKIKPKNYLNYGTTYTVKVNSSIVEDSEFTTAVRPITVTNVSLDGSDATIFTEGAAESGVGIVIVGMYDGAGNIIGYKSKTLSSSVTFNDLDEDTASIKVFVAEQQGMFVRKAAEVFVCTAEE